MSGIDGESMTDKQANMLAFQIRTHGVDRRVPPVIRIVKLEKVNMTRIAIDNWARRRLTKHEASELIELLKRDRVADAVSFMKDHGMPIAAA